MAVMSLAALTTESVGVSDKAGLVASEQGITGVPITASALSTPAGTNSPPSQVVPPEKVNLPPELAEVARLTQSGVDQGVILSYVQNTPVAFALSADQIVYLRDLGVSAPVLKSLVERSAAPTSAPRPNPSQAQTQMQAPQGTTPSPPVAGNASPFYNSLAPYGTWLDIPGYGWCWQPTVQVANPSWQPYANDGNWLWSDDGWYWNSYYSWGWAPFHYGRWCQYPRYGWLWCPDHVWGPAWVSWRHWGDYCGWAPLPFGACFTAGLGWTYGGVGVGFNFGFGLPWSCYSFVPLRYFGDRHCYDHRCDPHQARAIYDRSQVNNNFVVGANNRIINRGVDPSRVEAATHTTLRPVAIRDLAQGTGRSTMPGRLEGTGNSLSVFRPGSNLSVPRDPALASLNTQRTFDAPSRSSAVSRPMNSSAGIARENPLMSSGGSASSMSRFAQRSPALGNPALPRPGATQFSTSPAARAPSTTFRSQSPASAMRPAPAPSLRPNFSGRSAPTWSASRPSASAPSYFGRSFSAPSYSGRSFSAPSFSSRPAMSFGGGHSSGFSSGGGRSWGGGGGGHSGLGRR